MQRMGRLWAFKDLTGLSFFSISSEKFALKGSTKRMNKTYEHAIRYKSDSPDIVSSDVLDPIEYSYKDKRDIVITIRQPEFTSVCPMTGLPDFGTIILRYTPDKMIVELKSLKYYLLQYRNVGIFHEHVTNRILDDLVAVLAPKWMQVSGEFSARGGITTDVTAEYRRDPK
jgi:7-cyano-7-deazaguanine reductase